MKNGDMAHLVIRPTKISVRKYYMNILSLYYKITISPRNILYMFRRYGVSTTIKLSLSMENNHSIYEKNNKGIGMIYEGIVCKAPLQMF